MLALTSTPLAAAVDDVRTGFSSRPRSHFLALNVRLVVLAITVIDWSGTFLFFTRFRSRVLAWL
jgi:hypothetical protein